MIHERADLMNSMADLMPMPSPPSDELEREYLMGLRELDMWLVQVSDLKWRTAFSLGRVSKFHAGIIRKHFYDARVSDWIRAYAWNPAVRTKLMDLLETANWPRWLPAEIDCSPNGTFITWRYVQERTNDWAGTEVQLAWSRLAGLDGLSLFSCYLTGNGERHRFIQRFSTDDKCCLAFFRDSPMLVKDVLPGTKATDLLDHMITLMPNAIDPYSYHVRFLPCPEA